jgi:hypothetical protein
MSDRANSSFSLARKRPGAYFNDGKRTSWVQHDGSTPDADALLLEAIAAGRKAFFEVFNRDSKALREQAETQRG